MIRSFTINLDDTPSVRWNHVTTACQEDIRDFGREIHSILSRIFSPRFDTFWRRFHFIARIAHFPSEYAEEIDGIAKAVKEYNLTKDDIILLNIALDYMSRCTSAVVSCKEGLYHFRTLDWDLPELNKLLIKVHFMKGGIVLYEGYTFLLMVGLLTGMRPQSFAASFNFRKTQTSILSTLPRFSQFTGIVIRQALHHQTSFASACLYFQIVKMNGSGYIILSGTQCQEGAVIIKGPKSRIISMQGRYLVQTNHDPNITKVDPRWADNDEILLSTIERQCQLTDYFEGFPDIPSVRDMCKILKKPPIHNRFTVYTAVMSSFSGITTLVE